jgi:hypothetical protein
MRIHPSSRGGKSGVCLLGVFVLYANTQAATAIAKNNPYSQAIIGRNAFSLKPPAVRVVDPPPLPLPQIVLQGGMNILHRRQVLFKVQMPPKPGEPAREMSCVMSEGERQGEVEVLEIDDKAWTVKFRNHGIVQTLNLKNDGDRHP